MTGRSDNPNKAKEALGEFIAVQRINDMADDADWDFDVDDGRIKSAEQKAVTAPERVDGEEPRASRAALLSVQKPFYRVTNKAAVNKRLASIRQFDNELFHHLSSLSNNLRTLGRKSASTGTRARAAFRFYRARFNLAKYMEELHDDLEEQPVKRGLRSALSHASSFLGEVDREVLRMEAEGLKMYSLSNYEHLVRRGDECRYRLIEQRRERVGEGESNYRHATPAVKTRAAVPAKSQKKSKASPNDPEIGRGRKVELAFDALLEALDEEIDSLNDEGARLFEESAYDRVFRRVELAKWVRVFRDELRVKRAEWSEATGASQDELAKAREADSEEEPR